MYDFDTVHMRHGMNSSKWLRAEAAGCPPDIVPFTVADMEFKTAPQIIDALAKVVDSGMWGYTCAGSDFKESIQNWMQRRHGWLPQTRHMIHTHGVEHAEYVAIRALTRPGDKILLQPPVYHPFYSAIADTGRQLIRNPLISRDGTYQINFADLKDKLEQASMMIFCNPHNPVGRVWSKEEVMEVARLCSDAGVILFSDEIHCDLTMPGHSHYSVGRLPDHLLESCIIATSASKSFSLAGLSCATIVVPDAALHAKIEEQLQEDGFFFSNIFGVAATTAAYNSGEDWLNALIAYISANYDCLLSELRKKAPIIKAFPMEGTYLAWLDFSALGMDADAQKEFLEKEASLYLNDGRMFGPEGSGFARMNLACPRSLIVNAIQRLEIAISRHATKETCQFGISAVDMATR